MKRYLYTFDWNDARSQKIFEESGSDFAGEKRFIGDVKNVIRNFNLRKEDLILDFGCGIGKHAIEFAKIGYRIEGYDLSRYYINKARKHAKGQDLKLKFYSNNFNFLSHKDKYDFIFTINFPLGYKDRSSNIKLFKRIWVMLKKGRYFLLGFPHTREYQEKNLPRKDWQEKEGVFYLTDAALDKNGKKKERYIIINPGKNYRKEWIDECRSFYLQEIKEMLSKANFRILKCYKNLEGEISYKSEDTHFIYCKKEV